ncbi:Putative WW domain-binding protein [Septoria linicola]|uniref:WW domain-binding protein n=1 Tax=Septoria linicola TaxID=215465 RepID=A0A9Q9AV12_9PEZI|nr:putative WW domain-binding protein [Septoria linicola]USW52497.1 Putative WW domain-binding protein [Septoria linicola]
MPTEQRVSTRQAINKYARSWVMTSPETSPPFTPLPGEQLIHTTPKRVQLSIDTPKHYPGKQQKPYSLTNSSGQVFLTNSRVIYLPEKPTAEFKNFACPILNLHDSHVTMPWFGANGWQALVQPVAGGGIPTLSTGVLEMNLKFNDNGAFDFHTHYEKMRERLQQAVETQRANGATSAARSAMNGGVDVSTVPLEDLPAYSEESDGPLIAPTAAGIAQSPLMQQQSNSRAGDTNSGSHGQHVANGASHSPSSAFSPPDEPPPGYDEAQMATLHEEAEWAAESTRRS